MSDRLIRILAVEDVAADLMLAERALKRAGLTCTVERVETAHDFRRGLESGPDLILCDFKLRQFDGLTALEIANAQAPDIPFIFLSGTLRDLVGASVAREREHLAYELHDGICQQLAGISYLLAPLIAPVEQLDPGVARELEHIATLLREVTQTAWTLAHDRADGSERESSDLQNALQVHAARLQAAHGVTIQVDATAPSSQPLGAIAVSELAKLAREAMRNAIRHGRARSISVRLKDAGRDWQLEISDDGVGLPSDFTRRGGLGLRSMRHRAARLRGTFEIERLEPRGTRLRICWSKRSEN